VVSHSYQYKTKEDHVGRSTLAGSRLSDFSRPLFDIIVHTQQLFLFPFTTSAFHSISTFGNTKGRAFKMPVFPLMNVTEKDSRQPIQCGRRRNPNEHEDRRGRDRITTTTKTIVLGSRKYSSREYSYGSRARGTLFHRVFSTSR
jgi:hypothetical protein